MPSTISFEETFYICEFDSFIAQKRNQNLILKINNYRHPSSYIKTIDMSFQIYGNYISSSYQNDLSFVVTDINNNKYPINKISVMTSKKYTSPDLYIDEIVERIISVMPEKN